MKKERMNGEKQVMLSNWIKFWQIGQRQTSCATNIFSAKYSQNCDGEFELLWYILHCAGQKIGIQLFLKECYYSTSPAIWWDIHFWWYQKISKGNCGAFNSIKKSRMKKSIISNLVSRKRLNQKNKGTLL